MFLTPAGKVLRLEKDLPIILVVEDDRAVQGIVEDALTEGGFEPAIAASGEEAATLLKGRLINYRALVIDISLRGRIDGWEVASQAREIDPAFPIIYMTAGHGDQWPSRGVPNSILLTKPFAPAQLVTALSQLLNASPPTAPA
jgi:DNA-binding response OmpR family regulator